MSSFGKLAIKPDMAKEEVSEAIEAPEHTTLLRRFHPETVQLESYWDIFD
jgi:hypothetical protein